MSGRRRKALIRWFISEMDGREPSQTTLRVMKKRGLRPAEAVAYVLRRAGKPRIDGPLPRGERV